VDQHVFALMEQLSDADLRAIQVMLSTIQRLPANARMKAEEVFSDGLEALMGGATWDDAMGPTLAYLGAVEDRRP
jgi:hypothetical protein